MASNVPADVGMDLDEVLTPCLLVDLDAFESNVARMAGYVRERGIALRGHATTHKTPAIALQQIAHGAVGICCQKVSEAEAMVDGGVGDVMVSLARHIARSPGLRFSGLQAYNGRAQHHVQYAERRAAVDRVIHGVRNGRVESLWPVTARGMLL